jgi:ankyrin repeat protein
MVLPNSMWPEESRAPGPIPQPSMLGAAKHGQADAVRLLSQDGADVDKPDRGGRRPLYWAADAGHVDVVRLLIELGADVNAVNN